MRALVVILGVLGAVSVCQGRIITVDDDGPADFSTIQAAIDDSNDGDTVLVADGVYTGDGNRDIDFHGKAITVKSQNGPENSIIDCNACLEDRHRGFNFHSGEDANSVLYGFTITNGFNAPGGGIRCDVSSPTIVNCRITGNSTGSYSRIGFGGGIYNTCGSPIISKCRIAGNWGVYGGGIYGGGAARIIDCEIRGNQARSGGGIKNAYILSGCTISGNNTAEGEGGGVYHAISVTNCTITGNKAAESRGGLAYCSGPVTNCIIRNNLPEQLTDCGSVTYSDVQGGWPGAGNIDSDPCFAQPGYWDPDGTPEDVNDDFWVDGDYHLKSQAGRWDPNSESWVTDANTSPCIDAGDMSSPVGLEPFPNGGIINMGAYGGTAEASKSYFGKPPCEIIAAGDINGDCEVDFLDFRMMALHWLEDNNPHYVPPVVPDCIEFYVQTDKTDYHLGEDVEILYRVTNLGDEEVTIPCTQSGKFNLWVQKNDVTIWALAHSFIWYSPGVELAPGESIEIRHTWDLKDDDGNPVTPGIYDVVGVMYNYEQTEVEVQITIIP